MLMSREDTWQPLSIIPSEPMSEICLCSCCHTAGLPWLWRRRPIVIKVLQAVSARWV